MIANAPESKSQIQKKLALLGKQLLIVCLILVILIIAVAVGYRAAAGPVTGETWKHVIEIGVSLGVSVIPEGLVAVVTVVQAIGVTRMARKSAIVRKAAAVESIGSATVICSDKVFTHFF